MTAPNSPNPQTVCREMLREAICDEAAAMILEIDAAVASAAAESDAGLLHGLRRTGVRWKSIVVNARDLAAKLNEEGANGD
jgi:hypothetical protein